MGFQLKKSIFLMCSQEKNYCQSCLQSLQRKNDELTYMSITTTILGACTVGKRFSVLLLKNLLFACHSISGKMMNLHIRGKKLQYRQEFCVVSFPYVCSIENYKPSKRSHNLLPLFTINKLNVLQQHASSQ
jgi:hypothetical protein